MAGLELAADLGEHRAGCREHKGRAGQPEEVAAADMGALRMYNLPSLARRDMYSVAEEAPFVGALAEAGPLWDNSAVARRVSRDLHRAPGRR